MEINSIAEAVRQAVDKLPVGTEFFGNELKREVVKLYPKARCCYVDTCLRKLRMYRRKQVRCKDITKSLYVKVCK